MLTLFGSPSLEEDGAAIDLPSRKALALLAHLAVTGVRHRRATLAALLWPESDRDRAHNMLRYTLSHLRRALQGRWLVVDRQTVGLDGSQEEAVDVVRFRHLLMQCQAHNHNVRETCPECLPLLEETAELYGGDFLAGLTLPDSVEFDTWQSLETEALRQELVGALQRLVEGYAAQEEAERASGYAKRWLAVDPLDEGAHRALMRLYAGSGQQTAALRQYEACERVLREELGVSPSGETVALYEAIKEGRVPEPQAPLPSPSAVPLTPRENLPTPLTPLVGRRALLAEIRDRLEDPTCRLLTLVGPGGSGKTRLALEAAAGEVGRFAHGVFFVSLAPLESVDGIAPTVAQAMGFPLAAGIEGDAQQQLLEYLRGKHMLLVMDNFEHLLEGVGLVADILRRSPEVKVMATSRARLNARGESLLPIGGMDIPPLEIHPILTTGEVSDLSHYSAVQLFLHSADRVQPGFRPASDDMTQVARICQLVEGMPLAILLAVSWMTLLTPDEIAAQVSERSLEFLETEGQDVPARQRSMRAVLDHSWDLLNLREQQVLAGLSVFRGGFRQQAAQQVTGASMRELRTLVNRSLLQRTPTGRYEIHELLRQYAAERLDQVPDAGGSVRDRHSTYYAAALLRWDVELRGPGQAVAMAEMMAEAENARVAWERVAEEGDVVRIGQAMDGLCRFYGRRGRYQEGQAACQLAADMLEGMEEDLSGERLRALARAWGWQSLFNQFMGRIDVIPELIQQALSLLDDSRLAEQDTRLERAFLLQQLGQAARQSDRQETTRCWEESLALYRALCDQWAEANLLGDLAFLYSDVGERDRAERMWEECLGLQRSLGNQSGIAQILLDMAYDTQKQGRFKEAERLAQEASGLCKDAGDLLGIAHGLHSLGLSSLRQGRFAEAHDLLEGALAEMQDLGSRRYAATTNFVLALVKMHLGLYEEARMLYAVSLEQWGEMDDRRGVALSLARLGDALMAQEAYEEAQQFLWEGIAIFREVQQPDGLAEALTDLAHVERRLGRPIQARQSLAEGLRIASEIGAFRAQLTSLCLMPLLLADRGEVERAVDLYALATRHPFVANSRWFEDVAGQHMASVTATLPTEVVEAAEARGRARDLEATVADLLTELETEPDSR